MEFQIERAIEILSRTPQALNSLLRGVSDDWALSNEGPDTWSPYDVVGHFIHGEETDWIPRARIILEHGESVPFEPFDRFAQFEKSKGKTLGELLDTFESLRAENLDALKEMNITPAQMELRGTHPTFGPVTLGQLLASWVVHDMGHISQIVRVMSRQYTEASGPWKAFLPILSA